MSIYTKRPAIRVDFKKRNGQARLSVNQDRASIPDWSRGRASIPDRILSRTRLLDRTLDKANYFGRFQKKKWLGQLSVNQDGASIPDWSRGWASIPDWILSRDN